MTTAERYDLLRPAPATFAEIRDPDDQSFPVEALEGCETALVLFAAAWYGMQDACYVAEAGLRALCVDVRGDNLPAMRRLYPDDWQFVQADAYTFVEETQRCWDLVTVDCPSGHFQRCADLLPELCRIARHAVILGTGSTTEVEAPEGWVVESRRWRSWFHGGVYWTVIARA